MRTLSILFLCFLFIFSKENLKSFWFCQLGGHILCLLSVMSKTSTVHFAGSEFIFQIHILIKRLLLIQKIKLILIPVVLVWLQFQNKISRHYFCFVVFLFCGFCFFLIWILCLVNNSNNSFVYGLLLFIFLIYSLVTFAFSLLLSVFKRHTVNYSIRSSASGQEK